MSQARPFLVRLSLAFLVMLLVGAFCYIGLGLLVWSHGNWVITVIGKLGLGDRYNDTSAAYERAMAACFPADRDGDGVSDGIEVYHHSNPDNAKIHPNLRLDLLITGNPSGPPRVLPGNIRINLERCIAVRAGERSPVRSRLNIPPFYPHHFPSGLRLRLTPMLDTALSLPGVAFEPGPMVAPVFGDGSVAFDVWMPAEQGGGKPVTQDLSVDNANTGEHLATLTLLQIWELPAARVSVEKVPAHRHPSGITLGVHYRLQWPAVPKSAEGILVEAAGTEPGADWHLSEICPAKESSAVIWRTSTLDRSGPGELQFRIIPIRYSPQRD